MVATGDIPKIPLNLALLKQCSIVGVNWGGHLILNPTASKRHNNTFEWIASGKLKPEAGELFLEEAGSAMMKMLGRQAIGKVVISLEDE